MMTCPPRAEFLRQVKADSLDAWFVLHLLVCEECCGKHVIGSIARRVYKELEKEEEGSYWEPMDALARDWMLWMSSYENLFPRTID